VEDPEAVTAPVLPLADAVAMVWSTAPVTPLVSDTLTSSPGGSGCGFKLHAM
jgi:hypothetical protein